MICLRVFFRLHAMRVMRTADFSRCSRRPQPSKLADFLLWIQLWTRGLKAHANSSVRPPDLCWFKGIWSTWCMTSVWLAETHTASSTHTAENQTDCDSEHSEGSKYLCCRIIHNNNNNIYYYFFWILNYTFSIVICVFFPTFLKKSDSVIHLDLNL